MFPFYPRLTKGDELPPIDFDEKQIGVTPFKWDKVSLQGI